MQLLHFPFRIVRIPFFLSFSEKRIVFFPNNRLIKRYSNIIEVTIIKTVPYKTFIDLENRKRNIFVTFA